MKKLFAAIVFTVFSITGVFAGGMSVGAGASLSSTSWNLSMSLSGATATTSDAILPFGAKVFFDTTYFQLSTGFIMATSATLSATGATTTSYANNLSYLSFAALGKYPLKVGPVTLFPLLGVEYDLNLSHPSSGGYFEGSNGLLASPTSGDYDQIWLKGGVGVDVALGGHFYVRPEALFGLKLPNLDEQGVVTTLQNAGFSNVSLGFDTLDLSVLFGYKL